MILPHGLKYENNELFTIIEAVVRDCAQVCEDLHGGPEDYALAVLARYGLEPQSYVTAVAAGEN